MNGALKSEDKHIMLHISALFAKSKVKWHDVDQVILREKPCVKWTCVFTAPHQKCVPQIVYFFVYFIYPHLSKNVKFVPFDILIFLNKNKLATKFYILLPAP